MKPAIIFVITFVVGTAAAAGAKVMMTPSHPEKTAADSTRVADGTAPTDTAAVAGGAAGSEQSDSARAVAAATDTTRTPGVALAAPAVATAAGAPTAIAAPPIAGPALPRPGAVVQAGAPDTSSERRLAKVFTSMEPKQAAKVLDHMVDGDVQVILGYVGPKQAAPILSAMTPERAALLSKLSLQGKK